jgi:hypothetical protein
MLKKIAFAAAVLSSSVFNSAFAGTQIDVTQKYIDYVNQYFAGSASSSSRVWDNTYCAVSNPFGGCVEKGGSKIYGSARGNVQALESQFGNGWVIDEATNPWTHVKVVEHWTDLKLVFPYSGYSEGKKQCFPGDFYCGMEWDSLHPTGRIIATFVAAGEKLRIEMTYEVQQGHGDKPNAILRDAMVGLQPKLKEVTSNFINLLGSAAVIEIK